jgi:hypothetical protein
MNTLKLIKYVIVDKYGNPIYETLNNMKYSCIYDFITGTKLKYTTWPQVRDNLGYSCQKVEVSISVCNEKWNY